MKQEAKAKGTNHLYHLSLLIPCITDISALKPYPNPDVVIYNFCLLCLLTSVLFKTRDVLNHMLTIYSSGPRSSGKNPVIL